MVVDLVLGWGFLTFFLYNVYKINNVFLDRKRYNARWKAANKQIRLKNGMISIIVANIIK